jgi:hypothetical protein
MTHRKALTNPGSVRAVAQEPWVDLDDAAAFRDWSDDHLVAYNQINRQTEKYRFYVNSRFYRYGYAISHHDDRFTIYSDPAADRPSARFPNVDMRNLEHANAVQQFG